MTTAEDIRVAVHQALTADPIVEAGDIDVDVRPDLVLLKGTVPSQAQVPAASRAALRVPGVGAVHSLLGVAMPGPYYGDDAALAREANLALRETSAAPPGVEAVAREGRVILTGTVRSQAERRAAEETIEGVGGVLGISNKIVVIDDRPTAGS